MKQGEASRLLDLLALRAGCIRFQDHVAGIIEEYPFATGLGNGKMIATFVVEMEELAEDKKERKLQNKRFCEKQKALRNRLKEKGITLINNSVGRPDVLTFQFTKKKNETNSFLEENILFVVEVLRELNLPAARRCPVCKKDRCNLLANFWGAYRPVHQECFVKIYADTENVLSQKKTFKGRCRFFFNELVRTVITALPTLVLAGLISLWANGYGLLYMAIVLCGLLSGRTLNVWEGYKPPLEGKKGTWKNAFLFALMLAFFMCIIFAYEAISLMITYHTSFLLSFLYSVYSFAQWQPPFVWLWIIAAFVVFQWFNLYAALGSPKKLDKAIRQVRVIEPYGDSYRVLPEEDTKKLLQEKFGLHPAP